MNKILNLSAICVLAGLGYSCTSEAPFSADDEGTVRFDVSVNSKLTRAEVTGDVLQTLLDGCVVYVSDEVGLLHKWKGISNIPPQLSLRYGSYVAEAWAGDSVTASFDKKFFKGLQRFSLDAENPSAQVSINCRLANVVGSVDYESVDTDAIRDLKVTFSNSRADLLMEGDNLMEKAYFMMPDGDTDLTYTVTCFGVDGNPYTQSDVIPDVKQGHEYRLSFELNPSNTGGTFFDVVVEEYEDEISDEFIIYGKPGFSWSNESIKIGDQIVNTTTPNTFNSEILRIGAFNGYKSVKLSTADEDLIDKIGAAEYELVNVVDENLDNLEKKGIVVDKCEGPNDDGLYIWHITFQASLLNSLPKHDEEYVLTVTVIDGKDRTNSMDVRIANSEKAVKYDDPIVVDVDGFNKDLTAVNASSAIIPVKIVDANQYLGLQYRKQNTDGWTKVDIQSTRANGNEKVTLTGLDEKTTYEYRVVGGDEVDGVFAFESSIYTFTTEEKFEIPNASMENWYKDGNTWIPMGQESSPFWGSGNAGGTKFLGEKGNLTTQSTTYFNEGSSSACLNSKYVSIKMAAGNLFSGEFVGIEGLSDGNVRFGRTYNGSHPSALRVFANYRPQEATSKTTKGKQLQVGDNDKGQIFIALATEQQVVRTAVPQYFNPGMDNTTILGYGEVIWDKDFGQDGMLEEVVIPITYRESAKTIRPTYIIIVCSASMYGDYFEGADGSVMYVDDFELVY